MNYRHLYHAGNFADVIKHITLIALITALKSKDKPFCYLDTHAGTGFYDLQSEWTHKSKEYQNGIDKIILQANPPPLVKTYIDCVHQINNELTHTKYSSLRYYPGSPLIARRIMRPHDRLIACELHPEDYQALKNTFVGVKDVSIHHTDGFLGLKAFLPPKERRGLILIDPPYENPDEFNRIAHSLPTALKRFNTGIYAIWFPIKEKQAVERFYHTLCTNIDASILTVELTIYPDIPNHLNGCGLVVINPPWQFNELINQSLAWAWNALTINNQGYYRTATLK